jgi:uncharacterized membrane protein
MKYFLLIILTLLTCAGAGAQTSARQEAIFSQPASEQRRAELRLVLRTPSGREARVHDVATEEKSTPADRHLSAQERQNLRQQLRAQRDNVRSD